MAPSKTFNIAGLDCAFAVIANAELRYRFEKVRRGLVGDVNILGIDGALHAATTRASRGWTTCCVYLEAQPGLHLPIRWQRISPGSAVNRPEGHLSGMARLPAMPVSPVIRSSSS